MELEQCSKQMDPSQLRDALFVCLIQINVLLKELSEINLLAQDRLLALRHIEGIANDQLDDELRRQTRLKMTMLRSEETLISVKKSLGM
jgi:hypothetical protein